ncbi:MAG: hypothetical protein WD423_14695 [Rhodothermales bacterium]
MRSILTTITSSIAAAVLLSIGSATIVHAQAQSTHVMVRAVSNDAKIIGSGVGGARIVIQDAVTGEVLAEGVQEGGTGSTEQIITMPRARDAAVYDTDGAAGFLADVAIAEPTFVDVTAYGPLDAEGIMPRGSKRMLLLPGEDVLGDGVILELNGFTVEVQSVSTTDRTVEVTTRVTMLCGCPTEPGGLWDADDIRVTARLVDDGTPVSVQQLEFAGTASTFKGALTAPRDGAFVLEITASEAAEGNFGFVRRHVDVR